MAQIVLEAVSREFPGPVRAVDHIDLTVADQEFLVLVGPSGCGKTTTLRLIAGLEPPTAGTVRIGDRVATDVAPRDRNVAMVFQSSALYPHLTVSRNMAFGLELRDGGAWWQRMWWRMTNPAWARQAAARRATIPARVRQSAERLGIEHLLDRKPGQLSGGERQRVAVGKAMVQKPAAFLFDEPLSHLDAALRVELRDELKRLHHHVGGTTLYVTHDQVEAMSLGDRVAVMNQGRIQQVGTPEEIYARPVNRFVAGFVGTPGMNFLGGTLVVGDDGRGLRLRSESWAVPIDLRHASLLTPYVDRELVLGIRPPDVHLVTEQEPAEQTDIEAVVELVEPLGDTTLVHLGLGEPTSTGQNTARQNDHARVVTEAAGHVAMRRGHHVRASLDMAKAYWFDPLTGLNIGLSPAPHERAYN
ncbi:MAG: ABC transporter ATP-binding protein [Planctomycetia bacterium]|nr:ABC transporter ATP-binding protein [Planctomycetia bacterium]